MTKIVEAEFRLRPDIHALYIIYDFGRLDIIHAIYINELVIRLLRAIRARRVAHRYRGRCGI